MGSRDLTVHWWADLNYRELQGSAATVTLQWFFYLEDIASSTIEYRVHATPRRWNGCQIATAVLKNLNSPRLCKLVRWHPFSYNVSHIEPTQPLSLQHLNVDCCIPTSAAWTNLGSVPNNHCLGRALITTARPHSQSSRQTSSAPPYSHSY